MAPNCKWFWGGGVKTKYIHGIYNVFPVALSNFKCFLFFVLLPLPSLSLSLSICLSPMFLLIIKSGYFFKEIRFKLLSRQHIGMRDDDDDDRQPSIIKIDKA